MWCREPKKYKVQREINWFGVLAYAFFFCAFGFYMWIRIAKTLDIGLFLVSGCCSASERPYINNSPQLPRTYSMDAYLPPQLPPYSLACAQGYGVFVLVVEVIGATTVMLYGVNLLFNPVKEAFEEDPNMPGYPKVW